MIKIEFIVNDHWWSDNQYYMVLLWGIILICGIFNFTCQICFLAIVEFKCINVEEFKSDLVTHLFLSPKKNNNYTITIS